MCRGRVDVYDRAIAKYHLSIDVRFLEEISRRDFVTPQLSPGEMDVAAREVSADWSGEIG